MRDSQTERSWGRPRSYKGVLRKPRKFVPYLLKPGKSYEPGPGWPPHIEARWRRCIDECRQKDHRLRLEDLNAIQDRILALLDHFGIEPRQPGWDRDLTLMLAKKHEAELIESGRFSEIFLKYGLDPAEPDQYFNLVLKIAEQHIPGFAYSDDEKELRPGVRAMAELSIADNTISARLSEKGVDPTVRKVAKILRDPKRLSEFMRPEAAKSISELVEQCGNANRGTPSPLSDRSLRSYISQIRNALDCYMHDEANDFQIQFVEKVTPLFKSRTTSD